MSCKVCKHPNKADIERLVNAGQSKREVAELFDNLSYRTLYRHFEQCKNPSIAKKKTEERKAKQSHINTLTKSEVSKTNIINDGMLSAKEICDSLNSIEADAIVLFKKELDAGNLSGADTKLHTRLQIQQMKIDLATTAMLKPLGASNQQGGPPIKDAETIPAEVEDLINWK